MQALTLEKGMIHRKDAKDAERKASHPFGR